MTAPDPQPTGKTTKTGLDVLGYLLVAGVGFGLGFVAAMPVDEARVPAVASTPLSTPSAPSAAPAHPQGIQVMNLAAEIDQSTGLPGAPADVVRRYFRSRSGEVMLHVMGSAQSLPLHIHPATHVAGVVLSGRAKSTQVFGNGDKLESVSVEQGRGGLVYAPPYTGHGWSNLSEDGTLALLLITSPQASWNFFVEPSDERMRLGAPAISQDLVGTGAAPLSLWDGRLVSAKVDDRLELDKEAGPTVIYVAEGAGKLVAATSHPIGAQHLVVLPPNTAATVEATRGDPLTLLVYRPNHDGVSDILARGTKLYSQDDEELVIREFFGDRKGGVFVDVGAGHYQRDSTTFYLEEKLGWSGVSIDALAEYAADYEKHRPRSRFVNYLVTDKPRGKQRFYRAGAFPEVSSVSKELAATQADRYRGDASVKEIEVSSITLDELLDQLKVTRIDFLSMDIEEHEPAALAGFDISRFKPELVCIEAHPKVQVEILTYFTEHGYVRLDKYLAYDPFNWYFTPRTTAEP